MYVSDAMFLNIYIVSYLQALQILLILQKLVIDLLFLTIIDLVSNICYSNLFII